MKYAKSSTTISYAFSIKKQDLVFIKELNNYINKYNQYETSSRVSAGISTALTVASWAVAAYYWSMWWLPTSIPFAIAATVQVGFSTKLTADLWNDNKEAKENLKKLNLIKNDPDYNKVLGLINFLELYGQVETYNSFGNINFKIISKYFQLMNLKYKDFAYIFSYKNFANHPFYSRIMKKLSSSPYIFLNKASKAINVTMKLVKETTNAMRSLSWVVPISRIIYAATDLLTVGYYLSKVFILN